MVSYLCAHNPILSNCTGFKVQLQNVQEQFSAQDDYVGHSSVRRVITVHGRAIIQTPAFTCHSTMVVAVRHLTEDNMIYHVTRLNLLVVLEAVRRVATFSPLSWSVRELCFRSQQWQNSSACRNGRDTTRNYHGADLLASPICSCQRDQFQCIWTVNVPTDYECCIDRPLLTAEGAFHKITKLISLCFRPSGSVCCAVLKSENNK